MKKLGLAAVGAVIGGGIGYATMPGFRDWAATFDPHTQFLNYWHVLILHTLVGAVIGIVAGVALAIFLTRRAASKV